MKITLHFLLAYLADLKNTDQKTALAKKIYSGGEYLKIRSYIPFQKFITRLRLESTNITQLQLLLLLLIPTKNQEQQNHYFSGRNK